MTVVKLNYFKSKFTPLKKKQNKTEGPVSLEPCWGDHKASLSYINDGEKQGLSINSLLPGYGL